LFDAELVDDILEDALRIRARIAHRDKARLDPGRPEEFDAAQRARERAPALEIHPVLVVDVRRTVQAHSDTHVMSLEQIGPPLVDENCVGRHAACDTTVRAALDVL
jgi:hypothetical protein